MDIGTKIKNARIAAQLTQEQVADALGVSRQTISNWENGKTYPDIVSVIRMSDLYDISLDLLLKEEKTMTDKKENNVSDYVNYLDDSTNVVKSKKRLSELILVISYLVIWAFALISFWSFFRNDGAAEFSIMFLWMVLPVTTFAFSAVIGKNGYWGKLMWISPVIFGVMYMLAEYATFSTANMVAFNKINPPEYSMILIGAVISLVGIAAGTAAKIIKEKMKK